MIENITPENKRGAVRLESAIHIVKSRTPGQRPELMRQAVGASVGVKIAQGAAGMSAVNAASAY